MEAASALERHPGLFATLTPINPPACRAFTDVVNATLTIMTAQVKHSRAFLDFKPEQVPLSHLLDSRQLAPLAEDWSFTDSDSVESDEDDEEMVWDGRFCLSFKDVLAGPYDGWVLGNGNYDFETESTTGGVDLMLGWRFGGVRSRHARINFDRITGILKISPLHRVIINGRVFSGGSGGLPALNEPSMNIEIGPLAYRLDFVQYTQPLLQAVEQDKREFFRTVLRVLEDPIEQTFPLPSANDMTIGSWIIHQPVGAGAAGIVSAASRKNAPLETVAIKDVVRRDQRTWSIASKETEGARFVRDKTSWHDWRRHLLELKDVLHTNPNPTMSIPDRVFLLFKPLCRGDLGTSVLRNPSFKNADPNSPERRATAASILGQIMKGIACLHESCIAHRDIKPANIGVVRLVPEPYVVLLDFGGATGVGVRGLRPTPGQGGTVPYLAPETENEKYSCPVDVWAAGLVGHQLFFGNHPLMPRDRPMKSLWRQDVNTEEELEANRKRHAGVLAGLGGAKGSVEELLAEMLAWDPQKRMPAKAAVRHPALQKQEVQKLEKQKPKEQEQERQRPEEQMSEGRPQKRMRRAR